MKIETLVQLLALADRLEGEGQLNNAKLLRAAVDSLLTRLARQQDFLTDKQGLLAETDRAIQTLSELDLEPVLMDALHRARAALAEGRLPHFDEIPDPFVCRTCGYIALGEAVICPVCGAQPVTFNHIRPVFWLEAFDPFSALEHLHSTPEKVASLLAGVTETRADELPEEGGWSLRQAVAHLRDAQGVLAFRVDLILDQENPVLESKAVFEWATKEADRPETAGEIFEAYRRSRAGTVARLESLPLNAWWRCGRHEEFGELRLYEQASYFACHELTHLPQIASLAHKTG